MGKRIGYVWLSLLMMIMLVGCGSAKELPINPSDRSVETAIKTLKGVTSTCLVTEENDQNKLLNKPGAYTGAVFFRLEQVDQVMTKRVYYELYPKDACEAQLSGGGKVEIFANVSDAKKRDDYLGTFDDTLMAGYHTRRETMVIRFSEELTFAQQKEIEEQLYHIFKEQLKK